MSILNMYNLLPKLYEFMDDQGTLEAFLRPLQAELEEIYTDEARLREIQGIFTTDADYLKYISRSLGWKLQSKTEEARRQETATIVEFYDLKGTPYAIRLISKLTLDKLFKKLGELWTPTDESASEITTTPDADLTSLLAGNGTFVNLDWNSDGSYEYGYVDKYSYVVFIVVDPDDYTYGEIRPRIKAFKNLIHTMHPAGRYCYPYIVCRGSAPHHFKQIQSVYEEITGLQTLDDLGSVDDGGRLDENDEPIDPSVSTRYYIDWECLDDQTSDPTPDDETLDDDGTLDDGLWAVYGLFEIS